MMRDWSRIKAYPTSTDKNLKNYVNFVRNFDWLEFYKNWGGGLFFEWLRKEFLKLADVVLIDSRTGVSEMGGVCTFQLADAVVCFAPLITRIWREPSK